MFDNFLQNGLVILRGILFFLLEFYYLGEEIEENITGLAVIQ